VSGQAFGPQHRDDDQQQPRGERRPTLLRRETDQLRHLATEVEVEEDERRDREDHGGALAGR
jgi:hypothetical protein